MDDDLIQAYGRLTAHEFLLEVLYANWLAHMSEAQAAQFEADFRRVSRSFYAAADVQQEAAAQNGMTVIRDASAMMERFWGKVRSREAEIRAALSRGDSNR